MAHPGWAEVILSHPTGIAEVAEGTVAGSTILLRSTAVARAATAKDVTVIERDFIIDGDTLRYSLRMAARSVRKPDHPLDQALCAKYQSSRLPSSRCDGAGQEVSCGPSSTSACDRCSSCSSFSFAVRAPRRPSFSPCVMKWKFFGARSGGLPTSPPIVPCSPYSVAYSPVHPGEPSA